MDEVVIFEPTSIVGSDIALCGMMRGAPARNEARFASLRGWDIALLVSSIKESSGKAVANSAGAPRSNKAGLNPAEASRLTIGPEKLEPRKCWWLEEPGTLSPFPSSFAYKQSRPRPRHFEQG